MSSGETQHLQDTDLLRLLDGELSSHEATLFQSHMEACWTCRTRMEEFESAIGEYVRYRGNTLKPLLPAPPQPWSTLRPKFEETDRWLDVRQFGPEVRRRRLFGVRSAYWVAAAACVILAFLVIGRFEDAPSVRAAELLRKASAAPSNLEPNRLIRIKTRHRTLTRPALLTAAAASEAADVKQLFQTAPFSWDEPLSARSYAAWRDQLPAKRDDVRSIDQDESTGVAVYVIKTSTPASTLREATLTLRARDLRPMREMLEFTSDTVEIAALPEANGSEPAESLAKTAPRSANGPGRVTAPNNSTSPVRQELQLFTALHEIGADLGEPIEIRQSGSQLLVVATGLTATRKEQLRAALTDIPEVAVRFEEATANPRASSAPVDRAAPATSSIHARLQALLGSRESAEDFTNRALDASDAVMARVHAIRALARAFPQEAESGLAGEDRGVLAGLRMDHASALSRRIADLQAILEPVIARPTQSHAEPESSWQMLAEAMFAAAQELDDTLNAALAGPGAGGDPGFGKLAVTLGRLQAQFAAYQKASP